MYLFIQYGFGSPLFVFRLFLYSPFTYQISPFEPHKRFIQVIKVLVFLLLSRACRDQFQAERSFFVHVRRVLRRNLIAPDLTLLGFRFFWNVRKFSLSFTSLDTVFASFSRFNCLQLNVKTIADLNLLKKHASILTFHFLLHFSVIVPARVKGIQKENTG